MSTTLFSSISGKVDVADGIVRGVSVLTLGIAKGHNLWIDDTALEQILALAKAKADGVKVKGNHGSGIFETVGKLTGFYRDGNQIRADLELLKSDVNFDKVIEMAQKLPEEFGLSVSTSADSEKIEGKKYVRFKELESVDLVDAPAANPNGLFSQLNNNNQTIMLKQFAVKLGLPETATEAEITAKLDELELAKKSLEEKEEKDKKDKELAAKKLEEDKEKEEKEKKEMSALQAFELRLAAIETKAVEQVQLAEKSAKKSAIEALVAEASRDGKVIPLTDEELMSLSIDTVKSMFSKLPKGQVKLASKPDNKIVLAKGEDLKTLLASKKQEGALQLNEVFASLNKQN